MRAVDARRPALCVAVAGVLALGSLVVEGAGAAAGPPPPAPGASVPGDAPLAPACTEVRESLRPDGPLPAPGEMPPGSTMARIVERGRLIAGVDQAKYLNGYRNPLTGELEGADIDVVRLIAAALFGDPNRVQYVVLDIADRVTAIEGGQVDVVVNNLSVTCDRQELIEFSTAYMTASLRFLVPRDRRIDDVEDLFGQQVCTSRGSTGESALAGLGTVDVVAMPGTPDCMVELQRGGVAALSNDDVILAGLAAQDPQTEIVGRSLGDARYAVGINKQAPDLVRFVNAVLERARADGSLAASYRRWYTGYLDPIPQPAPARYRD
jgi:polar amino acid transport system substrate-binding protein